MSVGFLINFVNNTAEDVVLTAKAASEKDWETPDRANPEASIHDIRLAAFAVGAPIHLERHDNRATAPFAVTAAFSGGGVFVFQLDGCDATEMNERASIPVSRGDDAFSAIQVLFHVSENGDDTYNSMTIFLTPQVDTKRWMASYPDRSLTQLNIPGTHDTGTYGGNGESGTRCQTLSIEEQLDAGVRFLDLRLVLNPGADPDDLGIFHGDYFQHVWLRKDIMPKVVKFLADNPAECVVFCVNRNSGLRGEKGEPIDAVLHKILLETVPPNKLYDDNATVLHERTLADLQGCVVVLRQDVPRTFGFDVSNWPDDQAWSSTAIGVNGKVEMQNAYRYGLKRLPSITFHDKWVNVKAHLDRASAPAANPADWFINFSSASPPAPVAGYYPWDFATGGGWGVNYLLSRHLVQYTAPGGVRFGTIVMDFPEKPDANTLIRLLIGLNG
ncbi:hypothetical protein [Longimicrobium terrae]|uniref:1-phosphatidylinositol phosphodiesterase n=1 Tax=Longimicrobium terrae TaxID=1639882 RepID=A0A841GWY0_9BACT|nr:hypothetical protein [Longimicrobium terrae]MBB4634064.1 hypothetical protein [Longimicrobium terrae]MBB6069046.1 hypothetical protein [Longimicrobium terrae]NNC28223.1 hypothetical protein [Longimicrobium terrae]